MATGRHPRGVFRSSISQSYQSYCGLVDERPACIYGLAFDGDTPAPWFMGTSAIEGLAVGRTMVRSGRLLFRDWSLRFGTLRNWAYAKNDLHIRYLEALGCAIKPPAPHGPVGALFREFTFNAEP